MKQERLRPKVFKMLKYHDMEERQYIEPFHDQTSFKDLKKKIKKDGFLGIRIISDSMVPLIQIGEEVTVAEYIDQKQLKRFTPILYWDGKKLICHYVWTHNRLTNHEGMKTIATRSLKDPKSNDIPIAHENILGIVIGRKISFLRKLKIIMTNLYSSTG